MTSYGAQGIKTVLLSGIAFAAMAMPAFADAIDEKVARATAGIESKVVAWRRDIHQNPELPNRETRTAALVTKHLKSLKLDEVRTGVAHTGVVGILKGGKPGPVVALRADMDALPVTELVDLPFASKVKTQYNGETVGVMHACGHDAHTAILMGVAEVLAGMREEIPGTIMFIFQPAEEGAPVGEEGGAKLMLKEGLFRNLVQGVDKPSAIFGLHVMPNESGIISYRSRGSMAAADEMRIEIKGIQTHGSAPWLGVDPITIAGQMIQAIQAIPSRQLDISKAPSVITIGRIAGGVRGNIIPDKVEMIGSIRTFDPDVRADLLKRVDQTVTNIAEAWGATASFTYKQYAPVVFNDPDLTAKTIPALQRAAGADKVIEGPIVMGSEDFAYYVEDVPGVFFFLGINKEGVTTEEAPANHSPHFYVNETAFPVGVKALSYAALDFLRQQSGEQR